MLAFNEMSLWLFDENFLRLGENLICREKDIIIRGKNKDRGVKVIQCTCQAKVDTKKA